MRFLLDTHVLLWYDTEPERIPASTLRLLRDRSNEVFVSAISAWELGIKFYLGRLPAAEGLIRAFETTIQTYGFQSLPFTSVHALKAAALPHEHRHPFDRALVAQALTEQLLLVSRDPALDQLGVRRFWER